MTNFEKMDLIIEQLKKLSPKEIFELSVKSGIHNPDGTLNKNYTRVANGRQSAFDSE